jgi:hypothetical protein
MSRERDVPNHLSYDGARRLANRLQDHWKQKGYSGAEFHVKPINTGEAGKNMNNSPIYGVRGNLVGGLPPGKR